MYSLPSSFITLRACDLKNTNEVYNSPPFNHEQRAALCIISVPCTGLCKSRWYRVRQSDLVYTKSAVVVDPSERRLHSVHDPRQFALLISERNVPYCYITCGAVGEISISCFNHPALWRCCFKKWSIVQALKYST